MEHPFAFAAKLHDDNLPTYNAAMRGPERDAYEGSMSTEIQQLNSKNVWSIKPRSAAGNQQILPSIWDLKKKTYRDGRVKKYKALIDEYVSGRLI